MRQPPEQPPAARPQGVFIAPPPGLSLHDVQAQPSGPLPSERLLAQALVLGSGRSAAGSSPRSGGWRSPAAGTDGGWHPPAAGTDGGDSPTSRPGSPDGGLGACSASLRRRRGGAREKRYTTDFVFVGFDRDSHADFELVPRLIGRGGCNVRAIAAACEGKVRVRGRGSGHREEAREGGPPAEADVPLQIALSCRDSCAFEAGKELLLELLGSSPRPRSAEA
ncbi:unnamed protein product [Prorocentrum cordatum]|uniref:KHDC4/BBP-like KH-domain type I domain-containing protein n=1 Tax=Prorocentrum cordatum TaxID=2364126 RepID=A0ABN9RS33_9DINO|nr:unnamed protein product [Polarella glacialis]